MSSRIQYDRLVAVPTEEVNIVVDFDAIPECVCNDLAEATIEATREFFAQPDVEEKYQIWLAERKRRLELKSQGEEEK